MQNRRASPNRFFATVRGVAAMGVVAGYFFGARVGADCAQVEVLCPTAQLEATFASAGFDDHESNRLAVLVHYGIDIDNAATGTTFRIVRSLTLWWCGPDGDMKTAAVYVNHNCGVLLGGTPLSPCTAPVCGEGDRPFHRTTTANCDGLPSLTCVWFTVGSWKRIPDSPIPPSIDPDHVLDCACFESGNEACGGSWHCVEVTEIGDPVECPDCQ